MVAQSEVGDDSVSISIIRKYLFQEESKLPGGSSDIIGMRASLGLPSRCLR